MLAGGERVQRRLRDRSRGSSRAERCPPKQRNVASRSATANWERVVGPSCD